MSQARSGPGHASDAWHDVAYESDPVCSAARGDPVTQHASGQSLSVCTAVDCDWLLMMLCNDV